MEVMLASLHLGQQPSKILKAMFLHGLPGDLKDLVAVQFQQLEAMELAKYTELIWDVRNAKKAVVRAAPTEEDSAPKEESAL